MKSLTIKGALGAAIIAGIAFAGIGISSAAQTASGYHHGHHRPPIARAMRAAHLTPAQHQQIRSIRKEFRSSLTPGQRPTREQMKALRARVMAVLTPQQRTAVQQRLAQLRAQHKARLAPRPNATP
uniref:Periplasmic heavy metal sensor n=1 Tax=mine drainage metagenome TaxID=410659 RepID=E6Q2F3_9ZZZZ